MPERQVVHSTRTGAPDVLEVPTAAEAEVAALLRERTGYVARGLDDRVAQVDAQLKARGVTPPTDSGPANPPAGRRGPGRPRKAAGPGRGG